MLFRQNQGVAKMNWINVEEGDGMVVLVQFLGRNLSGYNFAENTITLEVYHEENLFNYARKVKKTSGKKKTCFAGHSLIYLIHEAPKWRNSRRRRVKVDLVAEGDRAGLKWNLSMFCVQKKMENCTLD